jgi:hypothetical protein
MPIHHRIRFSNTLHLYQMDVGCSLKGSTASTIAKWHHVNIYNAHNFNQFSSQIRGYTCVSNHVSAHPYAHPQQEKVFKHSKFVSGGCGMQFERFYSLNHSVMESFAHLHYPDFSLESSQIWSYTCVGNGPCNSASICPSTT